MKTIWTLLLFLLPTASVNGQLIFHEDFSKPNLFGEGPLAYYQRGNYHILAEKGRMVYGNDHWLTDFSAEVKTEFLDGDDNQGYGLMFRAQDYENSYVFCISGNGYLELGGYKKGNWFTLSKWERSDIIKKNGINLVKVECRGTSINLFINGQYIKTVNDASYTAGYVGIVAYNKAHIHFDDLKVYKTGMKELDDYHFEPELMDTFKDYTADAKALFIDNFSDKSKGWSEADLVHYEKGYYTVYDGEKGHFAWQSINESNYVYDANIRIDKWQKGGSAGITVRMDGTENYYGFFITEDQNFYFEKSVAGVTKNLIMRTPVVFDKEAPQLLRVECRDNEFRLLLNGQELTAVSDPDYGFLSNDKFGIYASKGVRADFLSLKLSPVPFSYIGAVLVVLTSWCTWVAIIVGGFIVFSIQRSRKKKDKELRKKREVEIFDMIKNSQGSLSMGDVMFKYKIKKKNAQAMLENIAKEYGGTAVLNPDGSVVYEFPDFMPSEDKIRRDIISFAAVHKGKITVTETANYLKMDLIETEVLLDSMIDGKRVKKTDESGIVYYEFVEIVAASKRK
jgi:hypothetical protein